VFLFRSLFFCFVFKITKRKTDKLSPEASPRVSSLTSSRLCHSSPLIRTMSSTLPASPLPAKALLRNNADKMSVLENVYSNESYRESFLEFARSKYAEENVLFLCEVVRLKEALPFQRAAIHQSIVVTFVESSSLNEVNLSSRARKAILSPPADFEDLTFLEPAWKEVQHQVVQNLCGPFIEQMQNRSKHFQMCLFVCLFVFFCPIK
jgi:hypothetical protein